MTATAAELDPVLRRALDERELDYEREREGA